MNTVRMKISFNMSPKAAKRPVWHDSVETQWHKCAELQVKTSRIQTWPGQCAVFLGKTLYSQCHCGYRRMSGKAGKGGWGGVVMIWPLHAIFVQTILHLWVLITSSLQSIVMEWSRIWKGLLIGVSINILACNMQGYLTVSSWVYLLHDGFTFRWYVSPDWRKNIASPY